MNVRGLVVSAAVPVGLALARRFHRCRVDPDLSAYVAAPACRCGKFVFAPVACDVGDPMCADHDSL